MSVRIFLLLLLFSQTSIAEDSLIYGYVVGVTDGDTITVIDTDHKKHEIRLLGIDAPETSCHLRKPSKLDNDCIEFSQPYGKEAKRNLMMLIYQANVKIQSGFGSSYGRTLGIVYLNNEDVNLAQLTGGYAWFDNRYANSYPSQLSYKYSQAFLLAKRDQRGLWAASNPMPPWIFRKSNHAF